MRRITRACEPKHCPRTLATVNIQTASLGKITFEAKFAPLPSARIRGFTAGLAPALYEIIFARRGCVRFLVADLICELKRGWPCRERG